MRFLGASELVKTLCLKKMMLLERAWKLQVTSPSIHTPAYLALRISSFWLFLSHIIYNNTIILSIVIS